MEINNHKRSITTEKVVALLNKDGLEISMTEAEMIINFLYFLTEIVVDENTGDESSEPLYKSEYGRAG